MKLQTWYYFAVLLLCISKSLARRRNQNKPKVRQGSADDNKWTCTQRDINGDYANSVFCDLEELCGIERKTGKVKGCVPASKCPDDIAEKDYDYKIRCNSRSIYCCCKSTQPDGDDAFVDCNDILDEDDDKIWKQACSLPEPSEVCRVNPTISVWCAKSEDKYDYEDCDVPKQSFCGIDRTTGNLQGCVKTSQCPDSAMGLRIVCDPSKPSCCCQTTQTDFYGDRSLACNNYLNPEDTSIWKQACSLPELKYLDQCKEPPPPVTPSSTIPSPTTGNEKVTAPSPLRTLINLTFRRSPHAEENGGNGEREK